MIRRLKTSQQAVVLALVLASLAFLVAPAASAFVLHHFWQGCAMCYQNAAASGPQGREALRRGILVLLLPTISLFLGIFVLLYRRRNTTRWSNSTKTQTVLNI